MLIDGGLVICMVRAQVRGMHQYIDTWKWSRASPFRVDEHGAVAYMERVASGTLLRQYLCYYSSRSESGLCFVILHLR